ncbi:hypothetical protein GCM10027048_24890 [Hymenobacter coalescens]
MAVLLLGSQATVSAQGQAAAIIVGLLRANSDAEGFGTANEFYFRRGKGSYRLAGADWQTDYLAVNNVQLSAGRGKEPQTYYLNQVERVVIGVDSFQTIHDVQVWGQPRQAARVLVLGRRTLRRPQVELFMVDKAVGEPVPVLRFPGQAAIALPRKRKEFQQAMLELVGDHPTLAEQLRAGQLDVSYTRQILETYLRWKPTGFHTTALLAAP